MHDWVSFNSQIVRNSEARIGAVSNAALYGKGVFTTMAIRDGLPFLFDKHWLRLENDAFRLQVDLCGLRKENLFSSVIELIDHNGVKNGRCRITLFDGVPPVSWTSFPVSGLPLLVQTADLREVPEALTLGISPFTVNSNSLFSSVKSCNYLERLHAFEAATREGFDESVRINENGEVVSACMANLFWIKDGRVFTPSLKTGCLEGTTREYVRERCGVSEVNAGVGSLKKAQMVFLTSAGIGLRFVSEFVFDDETLAFDKDDNKFFEEYGLEKLRF